MIAIRAVKCVFYHFKSSLCSIRTSLRHVHCGHYLKNS